MEASFWHQKWARGEIGFHQSQANPLLAAHFEKLNLAGRSRVFVPLCGKTLDIAWLLAGGYQIAGAELSEVAIDALFKSLELEPRITKVGALIHYSAENIDIHVGNIFGLSAQYLGPINAIYDRAAMVALPAEVRRKYASHLMDITEAAPQLLIAFEYDQSLIDGPPFSICEAELKQSYGDTYSLIALETRDAEGGMKGKTTATETAWLLQKNK